MKKHVALASPLYIVAAGYFKAGQAFAVVNTEGDIKEFRPGTASWSLTYVRSTFRIEHELDWPICRVYPC